MFYLKHVLWTLTLQTGTVVLTGVFFTLALCITSVNLTSVDIQAPSMAWFIMLLYVIFMVIIWSVAFVGAIQERKTKLSVAIVLWTIHCVVWVGLVIWSFILTQHKGICIGSKCPDVLWLLENPWRETKLDESMPINRWANKTDGSRNLKPSVYEKTTKSPSYLIVENNKLVKIYKHITPTDIAHVMRSNVTYRNSSEELLSNKTKGDIVLVDGSLAPNHGSIVVSIFFPIIYAIIFLYSWMILLGYRNEVKLNIVTLT